MCIFDNNISISKKSLLSIGFKVISDVSIYYSWGDGLVNYFPKTYKGNETVYCEKPKDLIVGFSENTVDIIKHPDMGDVIMFINRAKTLVF